jgi:hypothetical protein
LKATSELPATSETQQRRQNSKQSSIIREDSNNRDTSMTKGVKTAKRTFYIAGPTAPAITIIYCKCMGVVNSRDASNSRNQEQLSKDSKRRNASNMEITKKISKILVFNWRTFAVA